MTIFGAAVLALALDAQAGGRPFWLKPKPGRVAKIRARVASLILPPRASSARLVVPKAPKPPTPAAPTARPSGEQTAAPLAGAEPTAEPARPAMEQLVAAASPLSSVTVEDDLESLRSSSDRGPALTRLLALVRASPHDAELEPLILDPRERRRVAALAASDAPWSGTAAELSVAIEAAPRERPPRRLDEKAGKRIGEKLAALSRASSGNAEVLFSELIREARGLESITDRTERQARAGALSLITDPEMTWDQAKALGIAEGGSLAPELGRELAQLIRRRPRFGQALAAIRTLAAPHVAWPLAAPGTRERAGQVRYARAAQTLREIERGTGPSLDSQEHRDALAEVKRGLQAQPYSPLSSSLVLDRGFRSWLKDRAYYDKELSPHGAFGAVLDGDAVENDAWRRRWKALFIGALILTAALVPTLAWQIGLAAATAAAFACFWHIKNGDAAAAHAYRRTAKMVADPGSFEPVLEGDYRKLRDRALAAKRLQRAPSQLLSPQDDFNRGIGTLAAGLAGASFAGEALVLLDRAVELSALAYARDGLRDDLETLARRLSLYRLAPEGDQILEEGLSRLRGRLKELGVSFSPEQAADFELYLGPIREPEQALEPAGSPVLEGPGAVAEPERTVRPVSDRTLSR